MIVAFIGYAGSGKTTIARAALASRPHWQHVGFSDPMVYMIRALGVPDEVIADKRRWNQPLEILCGKSLRYAMQTLGTEWGRYCIGDNFWLNVGIARALAFKGHSFIDNIRFPNEFDAVKRAGGITIGLMRPEAEPIGQSIHPSESHIEALRNRADHMIHNNGTIESSVENLRSILQSRGL